MRHLARLLFICITVLRYGLDELALSSFRQPWVRMLVRVMTVGRTLDAPRGERLRLGLERLGPIFVKFGQVLSTRRDLMPADLADELAKLQDAVPPFPAEQARALVEKAFGKPIDAIFASFESVPELRIMAHISGDPGLTRAFAEGLDVHKATAAEVFNTTVDAVTPEQRRYARRLPVGDRSVAGWGF